MELLIMLNNYPSNITRSQFKIIEQILENSRKKTRPRIVDLYDIFCAILYVLKSGCQWRMLPSDYPKWQTCYYYFNQWQKPVDSSKTSILDLILKDLVQQHRVSKGRKPETSFCIIDAQSVKNTDTAEKKGYDANKKVSGIKRHIAVDTEGLPHAIGVTTADVTDRNGALLIFRSNKKYLCGVKNILAAGGYSGEKFANEVDSILNCTVEIVKRSELHEFVVIPKRWLVERSFAWLEKCRRLWKNCERLINTSLQMVILAFSSIILKRF